ncbi:hypothetical protein ACHAXM_006411 [Skeletonema potamos]
MTLTRLTTLRSLFDSVVVRFQIGKDIFPQAFSVKALPHESCFPLKSKGFHQEMNANVVGIVTENAVYLERKESLFIILKNRKQNFFEQAMLESTSPLSSDTEEQKDCDEVENLDHAIDMTENYGVKQIDIDSIRQKCADDDTLENITLVSRGLQNVKAAVQKLQQEQEASISNSITIDERFESVKVDMIELHQQLLSFASLELLESVKNMIVAKCSRAEQNLEEFKSSFITQVNGRIDHNLANLKTWFGDLEVLVKLRQTKLEQLVSSCAKECNVLKLQESIESDIAALTRNSSFLDDVVKAQGRAFVVWQKKMSISMLHKTHSQFRRKNLKRGLQTWRLVTAKASKSKEAKRSQKSLLKLTIARIISRRKRCAFNRWIQVNNQHRKVERRKLKASALIRDLVEAGVAKSKLKTFNRWRRVVIMDKMITSPSPNSYSMEKIIGSFNDDLHGAVQVIAHEIQQIQTNEIPSLRHEWSERSERMSASINANMNEAILRVDDASRSSSKAVHKRVDGCVDDLLRVNVKLQEYSDEFKRNEHNVERLRETHRNELDESYARQTKLEERLLRLEKQALTSDEQLCSLRKESTESINQLHEIISKNEERHEYERKTLQAVMNHFGDELLKVKVSLGHTQVRCEALEKECSKTKSELEAFRRAAQSENEHIHSHIFHPGIKRPCLRRIIMVGNSYEKLAKEKNYVTGINVTTTMTTSPTSALHIDGGRQTHKEEVDLPSEITSFAHDYALWISYQTDHESLTRMIVGSSQEDQVYAEDDMVSRRKSLVEEVKIELGTELEHVTYPGEVTSESSTRGLGLRWEARAIFLARVVDAIDAALSKHDQILLPAPTRLGRVRPLSANVMVCMACDRPMRRKGRPLSNDDSG